MSLNYWFLLKKRITENEYKNFVAATQDRDKLIILLLEKIARCLIIVFLNFLGVLIVFAPGFGNSVYEVRYSSAIIISCFMFSFVTTALSKPISLCYALKNPEKYKSIVRKKLGRLPDESSIPTFIP